MIEIARTLGIASAEELHRAARDGSLGRVPGIGPATERKIVARLDADRTRPARGLRLDRARRLVEDVAAHFAASRRATRASGPTCPSTSPSSSRATSRKT